MIIGGNILIDERLLKMKKEFKIVIDTVSESEKLSKNGKEFHFMFKSNVFDAMTAYIRMIKKYGFDAVKIYQFTDPGYYCHIGYGDLNELFLKHKNMN